MLSSDYNVSHSTLIALNNFIQHSHCHVVLLLRLTSLLLKSFATAISRGVASPNFFGGAKCLPLVGNGVFVWDATSQSTK